MFIFNVFNYFPLTNCIIEELKARGVKYKLPKKTKPISAADDRITHVFQMPLTHIKKANVAIKNGKAMVDVPLFLAETCTFIENNAHVEGIFRKGGSASKQRDLKQLINSGNRLDDSCHVVDACNLVKLFFRELPEPIIPYYCHDMLLNCMLLQGETAQKEALLLCVLLLQIDHIAVLSYFLEFLARIAAQSTLNKMDARNLATVLAPSLMPPDPKTKLMSDLNFKYHISVIEMLITNAMEIGVVPVALAEKAMVQRRKKRRSASITRMLTGIRKIVGKTSPTPDIMTGSPLDSARKRKSVEVLPPAVTVKRRREVAETTPTLCRMGGYSQSSLRRHKSENLLDQCDTPGLEIEEIAAPEANPPAMSCGPASRTINRRKKQGLKPSKSTSSLLSIKKKNLERRLSNMTWRRRRSKPDSASTPNEVENENPEELVTISRKEYEDMKVRVSCMAKLLVEKQKEESERINEDILAEELNKNLTIRQSPKVSQGEENIRTNSVQEVFERVVEQSEQLAPQLRKDMRLRWSSDRRVNRSPSERKIGSIRRRSRELARSNSAGARTTLQRGRPNTRTTGLRSPRELSSPRSNSGRHPSPNESHWRPANTVLTSDNFRHLRTTPERRMSIVSLRRNNLGMVQEKAKFFNSLHSSTDGEANNSNQSMERSISGITRRPSVLKENVHPIIKPSLPSAQKLKTPRSQIRSSMRSRATPLKAFPENLGTPLRNVRRSPRILARSLTHQSMKRGLGAEIP